jgi:MOSC domain-containing protein YiiM
MALVLAGRRGAGEQLFWAAPGAGETPRGPCYELGIRMGRQAMRTVIREEGLVGWYLRVLVPGDVPAEGVITLAEQRRGGLTVAAAHAALQDCSRSYPDLAALDIMSASLRGQLMRRHRDLTGGVPEED